MYACDSRWKSCLTEAFPPHACVPAAGPLLRLLPSYRGLPGGGQLPAVFCEVLIRNLVTKLSLTPHLPLCPTVHQSFLSFYVKSVSADVSVFWKGNLLPFKDTSALSQ